MQTSWFNDTIPTKTIYVSVVGFPPRLNCVAAYAYQVVKFKQFKTTGKRLLLPSTLTVQNFRTFI